MRQISLLWCLFILFIMQNTVLKKLYAYVYISRKSALICNNYFYYFFKDTLNVIIRIQFKYQTFLEIGSVSLFYIHTTMPKVGLIAETKK
jgi:hypothetical protein